MRLRKSYKDGVNCGPPCCALLPLQRSMDDDDMAEADRRSATKLERMGLVLVRRRSRWRNACLAAWFSCPFMSADERSVPPPCRQVGGTFDHGAVSRCLSVQNVEGEWTSVRWDARRGPRWASVALIVFVVLRNPLAERITQPRSVGAGTFGAELGGGEYGCHQRLGS